MRTDAADWLDTLRTGDLIVDGRITAASNATLLCRLVTGNETIRCVYKPIAGERPLWDFPDGTLAAREVAAYAVARAIGWDLVPPTVLRDGPFGPGMCQLWVDGDVAELVDVVEPGQVPDGWRHVLDAVDMEGRPVILTHAEHPGLRRLALFDVVINNADRKAGHILTAPGGGLLGVDHGVTFHTDDKLRTVLWGWGGAELTESEEAALRTLSTQVADGLGTSLRELLTEAEVEAVGARVAELLTAGRLPGIGRRARPIPWPVY